MTPRYFVERFMRVWDRYGALQGDLYLDVRVGSSRFISLLSDLGTRNFAAHLSSGTVTAQRTNVGSPLDDDHFIWLSEPPTEEQTAEFLLLT